MGFIGWDSWLALFVGSGTVDQKAVSYLNLNLNFKFKILNF